MKNQQLNTVCFGEVLWDVLPDSRQVGGAPLNVAFHLQNLGCISNIISKVGDDDLGRELLEFISSRKLNTAFVQNGKSHLTGVAKANISDKNEVTYKILQPVAYDYIEATAANMQLVKESDAFIFGSLVCRSKMTLKTLEELLKVARFKVFDVNLRAPFFSQDIILQLMKTADVIKLNEHELETIATWLNLQGNEEEVIRALALETSTNTICITKGDKGASLFNNQTFYRQKGFPVTVKDTIGSGDAFLAGLIYKILNSTDTDNYLAFACGLGSLTATYNGGTPKITKKQIEEFINS
jgi:fructokinase